MNYIEGNNENSKFYSSTLKHNPMLKKYATKLKCMQEDIEIYGNYDTSIFGNLMIVFEKCNREV